MTKADPAANAVAAGTEKTWFKVYEQSPTFENGQLVFPSTSALSLHPPLSTTNETILILAQQSFEFTLPKSLPSGQYLARVEQIGLHVASSFQGAQFYIGCAQINVVDGGNGSPAPLVSIPGVYTGYEPGILINIYNVPSNFTGYQARTLFPFFVRVDVMLTGRHSGPCCLARMSGSWVKGRSRVGVRVGENDRLDCIRKCRVIYAQ